LDGFYIHFKDNYSTYEKVNGDTVEVLFGFTDFQKFKESILKYKTGIKDGDKYNDPNDRTMEETKSQRGEEFYHKLLSENCDPEKGWVKSLDMKATDQLPMEL
jgi:hypothetical protein